MPEKSKLQKWGIYFVAWVITPRKALLQEQEAAGLIVSSMGSKEKTPGAYLTLLTLFSPGPQPTDGAAHI